MLRHKIHSIAACCENRGIGLNGKLPWKLAKEYAHYARLVRGDPPAGKKNVSIAGRKTGKHPTKGCYNIILSKSLKTKEEWMDGLVGSVEELVALLSTEEWLAKTNIIYNRGGSEIYKLIQDTPLCGRVYLTRVKAEFEADTFFPELDEKHFKLLDRYPEDVAELLPSGIQVENGIEWFVEVYERIP